jgi:hypothetical protein
MEPIKIDKTCLKSNGRIATGERIPRFAKLKLGWDEGTKLLRRSYLEGDTFMVIFSKDEDHV